MNVRRLLSALSCLLLVVGAVPAASASAQAAPAAWLRTTRETALWSGPTDPAVQFSLLPAGAQVEAQYGDVGARRPVFYPGDGATRQPGPAWIASADVESGGPPAWVITSDVDSAPPPDSGLHRLAYITPPEVTAPELAVVDDDSGLLLYGRAAHAREAPASTTKIATAIVALQHVDALDETVRVTIDGGAMALADGSSVMGLVPGKRVSYRTLLFGLLLPSGNDAAEQFAVSVAESRQEFLDWMNQVVGDAGLKDTHFVNPSGLDAEGHYASPYDLAQLARIAMRDPTFRDAVATPAYTGDGFKLYGHNPLLGVYPGADGVKTGTTDAAGKAIVASASRDGHRVYVVVMHSDDLLGDCRALFDWAWRAFGWAPA
jgi:D-alanyl-D-alanine carboxypeptidase